MNDLEIDEAPMCVTLEEADSMQRSPWKGSHGRPVERLWQPVPHVIPGVRIGVLVGIAEDGRVPLVVFPGQCGSAAVAARATIDIHGGHIGGEFVLTFEDGDVGRPIVIGCLGPIAGWPGDAQPGHVEVNADGQRLVVSANERLVLRCGKATITLTKEGKILVEGTYVSSRSSGVNRMKGGSVQLN